MAVSLDGWLVFATFWVVFVTSPGPNAANCIRNGMELPFGLALVAVLAILTQATAFLMLSASGLAAVLVAAPQALFWLKIAGAAVLIVLGVRAWLQASSVTPPGAVALAEQSVSAVYLRALAIATINAKSLAGYLAAFTQFVEPGVPVWSQMWLIMPTALTLTAISYTGYTALGAALGRSAIGVLINRPLRRGLAALFVVYGALLGGQAIAEWRALR